MVLLGTFSVVAAFFSTAGAFLTPTHQNAGVEPGIAWDAAEGKISAAQMKLRHRQPEAVGAGSAHHNSAAMCGGLLAVLVFASRNAATTTALEAVPKKKTIKWKVRQQKIRWYKEGDRAAARALELGRGIKAGTIDFIYGKPQDREEDDDDDYDDDDFEDDDDELEQKRIS